MSEDDQPADDAQMHRELSALATAVDNFHVAKLRPEPDAPQTYFLSAMQGASQPALLRMNRATALKLYFELVQALDLLPDDQMPSFRDPGPRRLPR